MPNKTNDYEIPGALLKSRKNSKNYEDNYDRIFNGKPNDKQFDELNNKDKKKGRSYLILLQSENHNHVDLLG